MIMTGSRKIEHKIHTQNSGKVSQEGIDKAVISKAVLTTLQSEAVDMTCVVNILITDDEEIKKYNRDYRYIDKATDVLSFPMQIFTHAGWTGIDKPEPDEDTGELPLGDIVISSETIKRQAEEYRNTQENETAYMIVHSTLHLLGYDHDTDNNERVMIYRKNSIMKEMGYTSDQ